MKKTILSFVLILMVSLNLSAQDTLNLLPPTSFQVVVSPMTDYALLTWNAPVDSTTGEISQGLLGYNILRDGEVIASIDHPVTEYYDLNLINPTYTYQVTAVYDLTLYGLPGETGESPFAGPVTIFLGTEHELPFIENFNTGIFETNLWTPDGPYYEGNWQIAGQLGNPAPGAQFTNYYPRTGYSRTLTSWWFNGGGFVDGHIFLDFDLRKEIVNPTETEFLFVDVYNGTEWIEVEEFTNDENADWQTYTINITDAAFGNLSRVRFRAEGESTANILRWTIDNIKIYRQCEPPTDLYAFMHNLQNPCSVLCEWKYSETYWDGEWLQWDNGPGKSTKSLSHFNVYRDDELIGSTSNEFYYDTLTEPDQYCYKVTAVYEDCESEFSNISCYFNGAACNVGVDDLELNQAELHPNPASSLVTIVVNQPVAEYRVYNLQGKQISTGQIPDHQTILDVSHYPAGIYLIKFIGKDGSVFSKKLVVQTK